MAGGFTLVSKRRELSEQHRKDRLAQRRDAYSAFLRACQEADVALRDAWATPQNANGANPVLTVMDEAVRCLWQRQVLVALAGPDRIAAASDRLCKEHLAESREVRRIVEAAGNSLRRPRDMLSPEEVAAQVTRQDMHQEFLKAARKALGTDRDEPI
ncbi:putative component of type VI protein secretion system [Streptomyces sp. SAI-208]|uniref:hypothetical protein n=1 Tax=Streptomyces sp. SAI-208 TaxID=2940550 RepID=UPI00247597FF|nr:hypothetical protein [Streptomyces sp. SAI-208]MDH6604494.1 putative component of type VI protein secretion system [Streptomyces sp. SAI-208]